MKNYLNYIKESKEQDDVIRKCIETETFKPLTLFNPEYVKSYIEENFTIFKPSSVKKCLTYLNLNIEKINKIYSFLDNIFSNLTVENNNNSYLYKYNNKLIAEYMIKTYIFYYDDEIYKSLLKFNINEFQIYDLINNSIETYLKIINFVIVNKDKKYFEMLTDYLNK